jgi:dephospho-CoA kinase
LAEAFPEAVVDGAVGRAIQGRRVRGRSDVMRRRESLLHPPVREEEAAFLARAQGARARLAVLDIPLLFETGGEGRCDAVVVVTAAPEIQRERVLARPGMTEETFRLILSKQMPDAQKRARAHFLVDTGRGFPSARAQVRDILTCVAGRSGRVMREAWNAA